jgi:uncharacterized RDD family membrane protein YckC
MATDLTWHPAPVDGRDPTKVVARRCGAILVDAFLVAVIPIVTVLVIGDSRSVKQCPDPVPKHQSCILYRGNGMVVENRSILLFVGFLGLLYFLVFIVVQGRTGASPGKALLGLRVVRPDGTKPGSLRSMIRTVAWVVDGITLLLPIALWSAMFTPGHRRVGDFAARTFVVRSGTEDRIGPPPGADAPAPGVVTTISG